MPPPKFTCKIVLAINLSNSFTQSPALESFFQSANMGLMKNKPIIFSILSVLCLIEPLIKVLYFKAATDFDFMVIIANVMSRNTFREVLDFWLVFPVAGLLILKLRRMTYFSFMGVLLYIIHNIVTYEKYTWPYNSEEPFIYNKIVAVIAMAVFTYFLSPKARQPFFDRRVRWWEPKTRYSVNMNCKVDNGHLCFPSSIMNLSQTGAFISYSPYLKVGDKVQVEFNFLSNVITLKMEIMNEHEILGQKGFGVRFLMNYGETIMMSRVIGKISMLSTRSKEESITAKLAA